MNKNKITAVSTALFLATAALFSACSPTAAQSGQGNPFEAQINTVQTETPAIQEDTFQSGILVQAEQLPGYSGQAYVPVNENIPFFTEDDTVTESFESYSELDTLGRCGAAFACVGIETMPTEERGAIGQIKPSGWQSKKYDIVDGNYLYNRCHLIGYQLTAENANDRNLITGTRYLNIDGMLPFENMVADYVNETGNHVLYRATPIFEDENLVASGVLMEGKSVEDNGEGILYCVYAYNVQPGINIDYKTGNSSLLDNQAESSAPQTEYVLNTNSKKFHQPSCQSAYEISEKYRKDYSGDRQGLIAEGYSPCKRCNP